MSKLKYILFKTTPEAGTLAEIAMTGLRVFAGLAMAFAHGKGKFPPDQLAGAVQQMNFPAPLFFAWCAALAEFLGGLLLAMGLLTRPAGLVLSINMAVAAFVFHRPHPFSGPPPSKEMAVLYLAIFLVYALKGGSRLSVDHSIAGSRR